LRLDSLAESLIWTSRVIFPKTIQKFQELYNDQQLDLDEIWYVEGGVYTKAVNET
jgi:hypothetical protein